MTRNPGETSLLPSSSRPALRTPTTDSTATTMSDPERLPTDAPALDFGATAPSSSAERAERTLVLIGMRGAGKTHLARTAAAALGWELIDMDHAYEARYEPIITTAKRDGWPAFREREVAMLVETLAARPTRTVVACGGGIVETAEGRAALRAHWPVVQALKPIDDVEAYLGADKSRPSLGEPPRSVYERRAPLYDACSDFDHLAAPGETDWDSLGARLLSLVRRIRAEAPLPPLPPPHSFFVSLTHADIGAALPLPAALWRNADAAELRVDLLAACANGECRLGEVRQQLALLRKHCPLPIIFTVRSRAQGGAFDGTDAQYWSLCAAALRAGVEWLDLEADRLHGAGGPSDGQGGGGDGGDALLGACAAAAACGTRVIGSHHVLDGTPPRAELERLLRSCELRGHAALAKLVTTATKPADSLELHAAAAGAALRVPHVAVAMGEAGGVSRLLNLRFTPVSHPLLPAQAAPGQLSAAELLRTRKALGYLPKKAFYIFGSPTQHSPSPAMHNAGFGANGCAHTYAVCETAEAEEALKVLRAPGCGGGSVTIPLKEALMPHVQRLSPSAAAIGSLNTLTVADDGTIDADNTDWVGIRSLLQPALKARGVATGDCCALVMGGGGTARAACYALQQMGVGALHVYNRSADKAVALAAAFGGTHCADLAGGVEAMERLDVLVSCVPGSAGLSLPPPLLRKLQPLVLDAAYRPRETPLLRDAAAAGCTTLEGVEMLFEQGCAQCAIWTHRPAPRREIADGLVAFLQRNDFGATPKLLQAELAAEAEA